MMTTPYSSTLVGSSSGGNTTGMSSSTSFGRGPSSAGRGGGFASSGRNPTTSFTNTSSSFVGGGGGVGAHPTTTTTGDGTNNANATTTGSNGDTGTSQQPVVTTMSMPSLHMDYIHDIQYDYYGRRLATCSADRFIRVWDLTEQGEWKSHKGLGEWQAHRGTVNAISWAHPEYGQLLASCGSDHSVIVWEEREHQFVSAQTQTASSLDSQQQQQQPVSMAEPSSSSATATATTHWVSKATLTDATQSVTCLQFAPHHLGLKIASGSSDGYVRIHEAIDVMNLLHWSLTATIPVVVTSASVNEESTSWSLSNNKNNLPSSSSLLSSALVARANTYDLGVTALSWCNGRFESPTLVVGTGQGDLHIYRYGDQTRSWNLLIKLPSHERSVLDVSWAPNVGRSYHLIASAGKDRTLKVHKLNRHRSTVSSSNSTGGRGTSGGSTATDTKKTLDGSSGSNSSPSRTGGNSTATPRPALELESSQVLSSPKQEEVWKCVWNVTGTVLASSGDGGIVYLWKSDFLSRDWKCVGEVMGATSATSGSPSNQNEMTQ